MATALSQDAAFSAVCRQSLRYEQPVLSMTRKLRQPPVPEHQAEAWCSNPLLLLRGRPSCMHACVHAGAACACRRMFEGHVSVAQHDVASSALRMNSMEVSKHRTALLRGARCHAAWPCPPMG